MKLLKDQQEANIWNTLLIFSLAGCLLFSLISITATESFLALAFIFWVIVLVKGRKKAAFPGFFWPLLAYAALSLAACAFSVNPEISFKDARELLLYFIIPITMTAAATQSAKKKMSLALLASGFTSALYSLGYFFFKAQPAERIQGFMGHYMTQAGLLLLFICAALCFLLFSADRLKWLWGLALLPALFCLALTLTRSAWIGFVIAFSFILLFYKPKMLILVPVVVGLFFFLGPRPMKQRALSIFSLKNLSNQQRVQYLKAGVRIIKEYPLHGTGPDTVDMVFQFPKYGLSEEAKHNVHLHNNFVQIAAERGIPTLLAWITFVAWAFFSLLKLLKNRDPSIFPFTATAASSLLAFVAAGFFEYNFADSEIVILFLYLISVPFATGLKAKQ